MKTLLALRLSRGRDGVLEGPFDNIPLKLRRTREPLACIPPTYSSNTLAYGCALRNVKRHGGFSASGLCQAAAGSTQTFGGWAGPDAPHRLMRNAPRGRGFSLARPPESPTACCSGASWRRSGSGQWGPIRLICWSRPAIPGPSRIPAPSDLEVTGWQRCEVQAHEDTVGVSQL